MKLKINNKYVIHCLSLVSILILRAILLTCKVRYINKRYIDEYLLGNKKAVLATWHRCALVFLCKFGFIHPMVMVSSSRDGELLANFAKRTGSILARGSSTRGGKEGAEKLVNFLRTGGRVVATVADGPQGPPLRAKPGLVRIAQRTGAHLLPIVWSADRVWVFKRAWDKLIIPKAFSTIIISASEPYRITKKANGVVFDKYVKKMEGSLNTQIRAVDSMCGYSDPNLELILREKGT